MVDTFQCCFGQYVAMLRNFDGELAVSSGLGNLLLSILKIFFNIVAFCVAHKITLDYKYGATDLVTKVTAYTVQIMSPLCKIVHCHGNQKNENKIFQIASNFARYHLKLCILLHVCQYLSQRSPHDQGKQASQGMLIRFIENDKFNVKKIKWGGIKSLGN